MNRDRNTTVLGIAGILIAIANAAIAMFDGDAATTVDFGTLATAVALGIGLVKAADSRQNA